MTIVTGRMPTTTEIAFFRELLAEEIGKLGLPEIKIPEMKVVETEPGTKKVRMGRRKVELEFGSEVRQPLVVSYGMGTDSTALLVLMAAQGIVPDVVMFADVGSEKPETYAFIEKANEFLRSVGFPETTIVESAKTSKHDSLGHNCHDNRTLPSLAFGLKGCSQKWKVDKMDVWSRNNRPDYARAWAVGLKVHKLIGYDGSPADCRRSKLADDREYSYSYPLREAGIKRPDLIRIIDAAGLPQPGKSACYFCPATKGHEIIELGEAHPELLADSLKMEANAELRTQEDRTPGSPWWVKTVAEKTAKAEAKGEVFDEAAWAKKTFAYSTVGLGRNFSWRDYVEVADPALLARLDAEYDTDADKAALAKAEREDRGIGTKFPKSGNAASFEANLKEI